MGFDQVQGRRQWREQSGEMREQLGSPLGHTTEAGRVTQEEPAITNISDPGMANMGTTDRVPEHTGTTEGREVGQADPSNQRSTQG